MDPQVFGHRSFLSSSLGSEKGPSSQTLTTPKSDSSLPHMQYLKESGSPQVGFSRWSHMSAFGNLAAFRTLSLPFSSPPDSEATLSIRPESLEQPEPSLPTQSENTLYMHVGGHRPLIITVL